ncbi:DUF4352 domain-containing protein [Lacrimispora sp. 210928-DFI.3.58]|uniref:DUF4352 domain-containing protein n=1 Tax=Lacrimispora sp. 210928-DFI.3.58 TaxID=2883214 RepID=UPI001D07CA32|nr:DUF4352 domain-containing protein [Lacrimispora sp. 210928-DFI.3.58]MCB7320148.1 DUF4352 domain-containing protein [Lacrimispora sp. 210928-DFI.3.58]
MRKKSLIITAMMLSCALTACGGSAQASAPAAEATTTTAETTIEETTEPETEAGSTAISVGETGQLKDWNITVTSMEMLDSVDNGFGSFNPDEGNKYMLVTATVENAGKTSDTFLPSFGMGDDVSVKVIYGDGYEFSITQLLGYDRDLINSTINPLSSKEGDMAFELPSSVVDSTEPLIIEFRSGNDTLGFTLR